LFNLNEFVLDFAHMPGAVHKKILCIKQVESHMGADDKIGLIDAVENFCQGHIFTGECRLGHQSATFFLQLLDHLCTNDTKALNISTFQALIANLEIAHARHLKLPNFTSKLTVLQLAKLDHNSLKSLYFADTNLFSEISLLNAFGKWVNEVKEVPDDIDSLFSFLYPFFASNFENEAFVSIVDRASKRNSILAANIVSSSIKASKCRIVSTCHHSIISTLVSLDNVKVQTSILSALQHVSKDCGLFHHLLSCFKSSNLAKNRELLAKSIAILSGPHIALEADFAALAQKDLANETTISSLVESTAKINFSLLSSFIETNLKASQKLGIKAAILNGVLRSGMISSLSSSTIQECFAHSVLKEILSATQNPPQLITFLTASWSALVSGGNLNILEIQRRREWTLAVTKPGGCALFLEKGWLSMSEDLLMLWAKYFVIPVLASEMNELLSVAGASLSWLVFNCKPRFWSKLQKLLHPFSLTSTEIVAEQINKSLNSPALSNANLKRVWEFFEKISDCTALQSRNLAISAHHSSLTDLGCGSWASLLRSHCVYDQFLAENYDTFIKQDSFSRSNSADERLLTSLLSLHPSLLTSKLRLPELMDMLLSGSGHTEFILAACRAASTALKYSKSFTVLRTQILCNLLTLPFNENVVETAYIVAKGAIEEHGALLVSLVLRAAGKSPSWNWNIPDWTSMVDSCISVSKLMHISEFSFVATVIIHVADSIKESECLLKWIDCLLPHLDGWDDEEFYTTLPILTSLTMKLLPRIDSKTRSSISRLLIEIAEWDKFSLSEDIQNVLAEHLKAGNVMLQSVIIKMLIAWATIHGPVRLSDELDFVCWLLSHHAVASEVVLLPEGDIGGDALSLENSEVSHLAVELLSILPSRCAASADLLDKMLSQVATLETEAGKTKNIPALLPCYISAAASLVTSADAFSKVSHEWSRLLSIRTTPTYVLRGKNIDRAALDFTRETRYALLQVMSKTQMADYILTISEFSFKIGFDDPSEGNCDFLFFFLVSLVDQIASDASNQHTLSKLYEQLQGLLQSTLSDKTQVYAVVLLGKVAIIRPLSSSERWTLIDRLISFLDAASEKVLMAVAGAMSPLLKLARNDARFATLTNELVERFKLYAIGRGASYGLAVMLSVAGTALFRQLDVLTLWKDGMMTMSHKRSEQKVIATLSCIELTAKYGGVQFEPYLLPLFPSVLEAFGDSRTPIRQAAESCADALQTALSPLATALILPPLLELTAADAIHPKYSWRAKLGTVGWLASMARSANSSLTSINLASWLPRIVPALIVALNDANEQVHLAAHSALTTAYASIIRSPEIRAALPAILRAICDPPKYAASCLSDIIGTSFGHAVDGPSLALLVPLLTRVLQERGTGRMTEAKRRSIVIISNLGSLMDPSELSPYLPLILPSLRGVLGDAVPSVRSGAARALGQLMRLYCQTKCVIPSVLANLLNSLLDIVFIAESASVTPIDRAGAAQAAAQVATAQGLDFVEALLSIGDLRINDCLFARKQGTKSSREALLHFMSALPSSLLSMTDLTYLFAKILTPPRMWTMFLAVSDDDEGIREVASKTIRILILRQALQVDVDAAVALLLRGCGDGRWKIRFAAFAILTDLLPALSSEDEMASSTSPRRVLRNDLRSCILSRLYLGRFDRNSQIRNTAFSLWKAIVTHPPRVILEIMPVLVDDIVAALTGSTTNNDPLSADTASSTLEKHDPYRADRFETASSGLSDILVKLADRILVPLSRRLADLFSANPHNYSVHCGVLSAAMILLQGGIQPALASSQQAMANAGHGNVLAVHVPKSQAEEALKNIETCMTAALALEVQAHGQGQDEDEDEMALAVRNLAAELFDCMAASLPGHREGIINRLLNHHCAKIAFITILSRKPQFLLHFLVAKLRKVDRCEELDSLWWSEVLHAAGPFTAPHATALLNHLYRIGALKSEEHESLVRCLLESISSYDPDIEYGLVNDSDATSGSSLKSETRDLYSDDLEEQVESALFSLGQFLETLWSAKGEHQLSAQLIEWYFADDDGAVFGTERFYDVWLDRLFAALNDSPASATALVAMIEVAAKRGESFPVAKQLADTWSTRSGIRNNSRLAKEHMDLLSVLIKSIFVPCITAVEAYNDSDSALRLKIAEFAKDLISHVYAVEHASLSLPLVAAILGAVIRALSEQRNISERLRLTLLSVPSELLSVSLAATKPFHPQIARLLINILKELPQFGSVELVDDSDHVRAQLAQLSSLTCARLLVRMSRPDSLISELKHFTGTTSISEEDDADAHIAYEEDSLYVARVLLLRILMLCTEEARKNSLALSDPVQSLLDSSVRALLILSMKEFRAPEIIKEAARVGESALPLLSSDASIALSAYMKAVV